MPRKRLPKDRSQLGVTMKRIEKTKPRDLFDELTEGMITLADARAGKRMLPTHAIEGDTKDRTEQLHSGS
jgi:hypothetical protein